MQHHQDFNNIVIGRRVVNHADNKRTTGGVSRETAVHYKLDKVDMGSDSFEKTHKQTSDVNKRFRDKMVASRARRGMTQQEFANFLNVKRDVVQRAETGSLKMDPETMQRIQKRL